MCSHPPIREAVLVCIIRPLRKSCPHRRCGRSVGHRRTDRHPGTALAAGSGGGQQFPGAVPKWATPANDAGTAPAAETLEAEIYLPLRDEAKAQQLATAVSTPADPQYRHWLSPQQWINTFSPTQADLKAVTDFVTSSGFTVTAVPQSRQYVVFRGPVAAMNTAFSTSLHNYRYANTTLSAPSSPPTVPAALASKISGVTPYYPPPGFLRYPGRPGPRPTAPAAPPSHRSVDTPAGGTHQFGLTQTPHLTPQGSASAPSTSIPRTLVRLNDIVNAQSSNTSGHVLHISRQGKRRQRRACDRTARR